jgi:hypothetical protein
MAKSITGHGLAGGEQQEQFLDKLILNSVLTKNKSDLVSAKIFHLTERNKIEKRISLVFILNNQFGNYVYFLYSWLVL